MRTSANFNTLSQTATDFDEKERELLEKLYESQKEIYHKLIALRTEKTNNLGNRNHSEMTIIQAQSNDTEAKDPV